MKAVYADCVSQLAVAEQNYNFWVSDKASLTVIFLTSITGLYLFLLEKTSL